LAESKYARRPAGDRASARFRKEQLDMRSACIQYQPDRAAPDEARVRQALRTALPDAEIVLGDDHGRYENITFFAESPEAALSRVRAVFDSPSVGRAARASCIVACQGEHGWDDYLLLHHYDPAERLDVPAVRPTE
jgi:hypothetical protein